MVGVVAAGTTPAPRRRCYGTRVTHPESAPRAVGERRVGARVELEVTAVADLIFSVAVSADHSDARESLRATVDGRDVAFHEVRGTSHPTRLHRIPACPVGRFELRYEATVPTAGLPFEVTEADVIEFTRPSRYCDSDRLAAVSTTHFGHLTGWELVQSVVEWVRTNITYASGSSDVTDGALEAYLSRRGVCRDSAQLVITFLRAQNVPARLVSVYAPGLHPMDFHAVTEVAHEGRWLVVDATGMAPRPAMVRIATGRDAADAAFLTVLGGRAHLLSIRADAVLDPAAPPPDDDGTRPVTLA